MVVDRSIARRFIDSYKAFLESLLSDKEKNENNLLQRLVLGREHFIADRGLLDIYCRTHPEADSEMLDAIASLRLGRWLYLKDTSTHSIFLSEDGNAAYGVLGLNDSLHVVANGERGLVMLTGLVELNGSWVCDGLVEVLAMIGKNMLGDLNASYQLLRSSGRFSRSPTHRL